MVVLPGAEEDHNKSRPSHLDTPPDHHTVGHLNLNQGQYYGFATSGALFARQRQTLKSGIESEYHSVTAWSVFK